MAESSGKDDSRIDTTSGEAATAVSAANGTLHVCSPGNGQACTSCAVGSALQTINSPPTTGQDQESSVTSIRSVGFQVPFSVLRISRNPDMAIPIPSHNDFIHFCVNIQPRLLSPMTTVSLHALQQSFARLMGPFSYSIHQDDSGPPLLLVQPAHPLRVSFGRRDHGYSEEPVQLLIEQETREGGTADPGVSGMDSVFPDGQTSSFTCDSVECVLCLAEVLNEARALSCGHVFHSSCVGEWLESFAYCPVCRADVGTTPDQPRHITVESWSSNLMTSGNLGFNSILSEALSEIGNGSNGDWYSAPGSVDEDSVEDDGVGESIAEALDF